MTDWKAIQKKLDDNLERERVARNNRTDAAINKAMADPGSVPVVALERYSGEEAVCPKCGNRNALLGRRWLEGGRELLVCRDCFYACFEKRDGSGGRHRY